MSQAYRIDLLISPLGIFPRSIREALEAEDRDLILWLALHGIQPREIAWALHQNIPSEPWLKEKALVSDLRRLVEQFIGELVWGEGGAEEPDALVARLIQRDDELNWSPYRLERAVAYARTTDNQPEDAIQQLRKRQADRAALNRWRGKNDGQAPVPGNPRGSKEYYGALRGLRCEGQDQQGLVRAGYRMRSHAVERLLMRQRLVRMRMRQTGGSSAFYV